MDRVSATFDQRLIPTYPIPDPDPHPMFFEKRVYQGSSGRVYPLPFYSRVSDQCEDRHWGIWTLQNEYVRVELMPELGGRVWRALDKTNDYDLFYHQPVVKPALVGLAGPWISGGIEFNWPQHHRPATYMPADAYCEEHADGSRTLWMSDHDPMAHVKGMLGVTITPGCSRIDMHVRLYNRTPYKQTFLWWANAAAKVHDEYQSFFPPDVQYVADHAVRATSRFPIAVDRYYGVDYAPGTDLTWYKNIPVPTSYMITKTDYDFFGGYDHAAQGGFVHVADRHISPGKKQWTWGNHAFGKAWDRELTEPDNEGNYPPYIELMAGLFTDNQPDFSYLMPYETKTFTHTWWPIREIGVVHQASKDYAAHLSVDEGRARIGLCSSVPNRDVRVRLLSGDLTLLDDRTDVAPDQPAIRSVALKAGIQLENLKLEVLHYDQAVLTYEPPILDDNATIPKSATEPAQPDQISSSDELYLTGEHLEQYRHPTRSPESYWLEALDRDPGDLRCNTAMGRKLLERGLLDQAVEHLQAAVDRSRIRHPNPESGEPLYFQGLALKRRGEIDDAYGWLYKSTWNAAWRGPGYYQLATIDAARGRFDQALAHLDSAMQANPQHSQARVLSAALSRRRGDIAQAIGLLDVVLSEDPLDHWARFERILAIEQMGDSDRIENERESFAELSQLRATTLIDLAFDYTDSGFFEEAARLLNVAGPNQPAMIGYTLAWCYDELGRTEDALATHASANGSETRWCFPDRYEEELVLRAAIRREPSDALACLALGSLLYDKRRYEDAIALWETGREHNPEHAGLCRNLGIAYYNVRKDSDAAVGAYEAAYSSADDDAQVLLEYDLLRKITGNPPQSRLELLEKQINLVTQRDDLVIEFVALLNLCGRHEESASMMANRRFHPWEGGEGQVLAQYDATCMAQCRTALNDGNAEQALEYAEKALQPPPNLGEARHLLANTAEIHFHIGLAYRALGKTQAADQHFREAAENTADFADMGVQPYSDKSFYKGMALQKLSRDSEAKALFKRMVEFGKTLQQTQAKIDYFATSLPDLLVFDVDLQQKLRARGMVIEALGCLGLGNEREANRLLDSVLREDPSNQTAQQHTRAALQYKASHTFMQENQS